MGAKWNFIRILGYAFAVALIIHGIIRGYFEDSLWYWQAMRLIAVTLCFVWGISAVKDFLGITEIEDKAKTDKAFEANVEAIVNAETLFCVIVANAPTARLKQLSDLEALSQIISDMMNDKDIKMVHGQIAHKLR